MAAALEAADAGADVALVERRPVLGGLTTSIERGGRIFDNGQHVFLRCCSSYLGFLDRIGAASDVHLQRRMEVPVLAPGGRRAVISRNNLPAPLHLGPALARYRHLSLADRVRLPMAALALRRLSLDDPSLDDVTFADWLRRRRQSARSIDALWNLITLPTVNLPAEEASLAMAATVFKIGLLDRSDAGDIGWSRIPLVELHGKLALRGLERAGVEVLLGERVTRIEPAHAGHRLQVGSRTLDADAVIIATAARTAADMADVPEARAATALGASPIVNVHIVLDRRVTDLPVAACIDSPLQFVFDRTESSGTKDGQCLSISLSAATGYLALPSRQLVQQFFQALGDVFPLARRAEVVDGMVTRERAATFRACAGSARLRPGTVTGNPGLFLAGAWCDTGWPATMEGAVRSGANAARAARQYLRSAADRSASAQVAGELEEVPA